jgi:hypothetical protein
MIDRLVCTSLTAALLIGSTSALAAPAPDRGRSSTEVAVGTSKPAATSEKKICRKLPATGSRMTERVCLTASDWKKVEAEVK